MRNFLRPLSQIKPKIYFFLVFGIVFALIARRHITFHSNGFDLGLFHETILQYSKFLEPISQIRGINTHALGDHFHPTLIALVPLYWIWNSPLMLLGIQAFFYTLGGAGIYSVCRAKGASKTLSYIGALMWLIFYGNVCALMFDFHEIMIAAPLFPWLYWSVLKKKYFLYWILFLWCAFTKEQITLTLVFFGIFLLFSKNKKLGVSTIIFSVTLYTLIAYYFLPMFGGDIHRYWTYSDLGDTPSELIINAAKHPLHILQVLLEPEKVRTYIFYFLSGGFVLFFRPKYAIIVIPAFATKFLSSRPEFWTIDFHYHIDLFWVIPTVFIEIVTGLKRKGETILVLYLIFFILLQAYPAKRFVYELQFRPYQKDLIEAITMLPIGTSVSASNNISPHLVNEHTTSVWPNIQNADYIIIDNHDTLWPINQKENDTILEALKKGEDYGKIKLPFMKQEIYMSTSQYRQIYGNNGVFLFQHN